ncbi:cell division protein ZapA [Planktomarina sp.]|jgi:cell division protein ZapA|nr:cell division protein ZapA [Planktomarina sp.]MDC1249053.1 cell division protein ZapA [Planktomarina sp.]|tara:strand:+ start:519 stop:905 length:387 start_codon:yes stop_codon:yes gene_type:complete
MPDINLNIGGRSFAVACPEGEEASLEAAAQILSADARTLVEQSKTLSESQMLLISGLMSADRAISIQEDLKKAEVEINNLKLKIEEGSMEKSIDDDKLSSSNLTTELYERLSKLSLKAESLADSLEKK